MNAYRSSAAKAKPTLALVIRGKRALAVTLFLSVFAAIPLAFMTLVTIHCERDARDRGTCRTSERGLLVWRSRELPLEGLSAIRADEHVDSDNDTLSQLVLVTTEGEVPLGHGSDNMDLEARRRVASSFAEFRSGDAPRFDATTGYNGFGFALVWATACVFGILASRGRTVRIVIDPARGAIRVRKWFRTIDLPLSRDVRIVSEKDSEGADTWRLVAPSQQIALPQNVRSEDVTSFNEALDAAVNESTDS